MYGMNLALEPPYKRRFCVCKNSRTVDFNNIGCGTLVVLGTFRNNSSMGFGGVGTIVECV